MIPPYSNRMRAQVAIQLRILGCTFQQIAEVLNLKTRAGYPHKDRARQLVAKGRRFILQKLEAAL